MSTGRTTSDVMEPRRRSASSAAWPTVAMLALVAVVIVAASTVYSQSRDARRSDAQIIAERTASSLGRGFVDLQDGLEARAPRLALGAPTPPPPGADALYWLPDGSSKLTPASDDISAGLGGPELLSALTRSRDRGGAVLVAPVSDAPSSPLIVLAVYESDDGSASLTLDGTATDRRAALAGHAIATIDVSALMDGTTEPWRVTDGRRSIGEGGDVGSESVSAAVDVLERRWVVQIGVAGSVGSEFWVVLGLGVLGAAVAAAAEVARRRTGRRHVAETARARAQAQSIRTLAGVVQESSDLATIFPALSVQLADELGLQGVSLSVYSPDGGNRASFVHGRTPDAGVPTGRPDHADAGDTVALDLHRGSRSVAVMRVLAGRALSSNDIDLLQIAGEMVTSSVVAARSIEQQQDALARLRVVDELKTTFLGVASHELRTPVTAIAGLASLLSERWDDLAVAERRVFTDRIAANAASLTALVQDLLDMARLERGDVELDLRPVELGGTVQLVLDRLDHVWETHRVECHVDGEVWIRADSTAIDRIVTNLVSNAVKFSPDGAPVTVTVEGRGATGRLVIDDGGTGIAENEREQIFERFYRGSGDEVVRTRGVGIGLSVVKDFVDQMGAVIDVGESPAGGARFEIEIPAADPLPNADREVADVSEA